MRKDMRLGLAVGGVLAIVVLAYAVLFSGSKDKNKKAGDAAQQALGSGGGSAGSAGQGSAGASPDAGRAGGGLSGSALDSGSGASGRNSGNQIGGTGRSGTGSAGGLGATTPESGSGGATQPPRGWNWAAALRNGSGGAAHTETPDPNRNLLPETAVPRPREDSAGPATRPGGAQGGLESAERPGRARGDESASGGSPGSGVPKKRVVKAGESYWTIAKEEYGNAAYVSHLIRANPGVDPKTLKAGATISVPPKSEVVPAGVTDRTLSAGAGAAAQIDPAKQYRVQAGDNLSAISKKLYGRADRVEEIYELNKDVIGPNKSALKRDMVLALPEPPTTRQGG